MTPPEARTVGGWLREAAYIQRNASWQGWTGAMKFVAIRNMLREQGGIGGEAFDNWMRRMRAYSETTFWPWIEAASDRFPNKLLMAI